MTPVDAKNRRAAPDYACYIICKAYAAQRFPYLPTLEDVITNAVAEMFKEVE